MKNKNIEYVIKKLIGGLSANLFAQIVSFLIQIVSVPVFLKYLDLKEYGYWIVLSAAPAYFSMADGGIVSVAINKMTILASKGETESANRVFSSSLSFLTVSVLVVEAIFIFALYFVDSELVSYRGWKVILVILITNTVVSMYAGLIDAVFRASNKYAQGTYIINCIRVAEWLVGVLGLVFFKELLGVAVGLLVGRSLVTLLIVIYASRVCNEFKWTFKNGSFKDVRKMLMPAAGFIAFPIGNAISIQGMSMLVGGLMGMPVVAVFNSYRTVSRAVVQIVAVVSHTLWPEFSRIYGKGNMPLLAQVFWKGFFLTILTALLAAACMYLTMPYVLKTWTHGKIIFNERYGLLFALATLAASLWHIPRILLLATNRHSSASVHYIFSSLVSILIAWALGVVFSLNGVIVAMIFSEIYMFVICLFNARIVLGKDNGYINSAPI
jgi:O-antigen/teichoic acid export membrane protein